MTTTSIDWKNAVEAGALVLFMIVLANKGSKRITEEEFLVGSRDVPDWKLAGTVASGVIGGGVLLVFSEYAFRYGLAALCIIAGLVLGTLAMIPVALKFKNLADRQLFYTLPDLYSFEWGSRAGLLTTVIVAFWTIGFIVMQLVSAGDLLALMTGLPYWVGVVVAAATVASYLIASGFRAVVITDILQYLALLLLLVFIFPLAATKVDLVAALRMPSHEHFRLGDAIGFFVLGALNMVVSANMWQRFYAAKNLAHARRGFGYSAVLIALSGLLLLIPPLFARTVLPNVPGNHALTSSLALLIPRWLLGFGVVAILSTVIASLDTMVFILGLSIGHDLYVRQLKMPVGDRVKSTQVAIAVALFVGACLSIVFRELLSIGLALSSLGLVLAPSLLTRLTRWKLPPRAVEVGLALGILTAAGLVVGNFFVPGLLSPENTLAALVAAIIGTAVGRVFS